MALSSASGNFLIKSGIGVHGNVWTDEHDCIPLKKRLELLLESKRFSAFADIECDKKSEGTSLVAINVAVKKEEHPYNFPVDNHAGFGQEENNERLLPEQNHAGMLTESCSQGTEIKEYVTSREFYLEKNGRSMKIKAEIAGGFANDLDHVVLKERRKLLLSRKSLESTKSVREGNCLLPTDSMEDVQQSSVIENENVSIDAEPSIAENWTGTLEEHASNLHRTLKSGSLNSIITGSPHTALKHSALMESCQNKKCATSRNITGITDRNRVFLSENVSAVSKPYGEENMVSDNPHSLHSALSSTFANIKAEPLDYKELQSLDNKGLHNFPSDSMIPVKNEMVNPEKSCGDDVDHMLLRDRINMLASGEAPDLDNSRNFKCSKQIAPSVLNCSPVTCESVKPLRIIRPRKRRKTATDSVETALEEDAPGLLQVLINKGVSVNDIKLYGETESKETVDESLCEDSFSELEAVISKLFSQRQSFFKFGPIRCAKGEKPGYCLACLMSLVEQARYLQFRKWPVEWGWSRDLQSFVFVFERHNRIVLERPEYGFATYFFELVDSMPIDWQIKRLVTAMKLTSCSRITLIENKALQVGEDLSECEARVLMEYGWVPNTGLGTMLNYCDRVVHDRKSEKDSSEWRSKIGRLLMDGYNGGTIVSTDIPKVVEYYAAHGPQIKLEI